MTAPAPERTPTPDTSRCPACRTSLTDPPATACTACGLRLTGPPAQRLWMVDSELLRLDAQRGALLVERSQLLTQLRPYAGTAPAPVPHQVWANPFAPGPGSQARPGGVGLPPVPGAPPRPESSPKVVQNLLLGLGGLLLTGAGLVFAAVTYQLLGPSGRAVVLVLLTLAVASTTPSVLRRGLSATAETLGAVSLVLAWLAAYGLRTLGLFPDSEPLTYLGASAAVLAVVAGAYAVAVPLLVARLSAVVLSQLAVLLVLVGTGASAVTAALVLALLVAVDLTVLALLAGRQGVPSDVRVTLLMCLMAASALGTMTAIGSPNRASAAGAASALLAHAAVLAGASLLVRDRVARGLLGAAPVLLLGLAAAVVAEQELSEALWPLVPAAVALLAGLVVSQLPRDERPGPVAGSLIVAAATLLVVGGEVVTGLVLPLLWVVDPWSLPAGAGAREAVGPGTSWSGTVVTTLVVALAALTTGLAGLVLHRVRSLALPAGALIAGTVMLLPLGLSLPHPAALAVLLVTGAGLATGGVVLLPRSTPAGVAVTSTGIVVGLFAGAWSLADREATLVVLPVLAALLAGLSTVRRLPGGLAGATVALGGLLTTASVGAIGAATDLASDQVGGLLLLPVAALLALAAVPRLDELRRAGAEGAAGLSAGIAVVLAVRDPGWLSWVLAASGLLLLATALRPSRRRAAIAGGLLLTASSWVRLADAGVSAPEPYVLPLAALALGLGHLRRRADPATRSWAAYGAGLSILLVPSLLASVDDATPTRALLVGLLALGVLLLGARQRLQAPLAVGAGVLILDVLQLIGPYATALPRWISLGLAGVLLVVIGATYEQGRREVARLRESYDALT